MSQGFLLTYESEDRSITKKSHISRTWLLLAGFAIENLLKGLLIAEHPEYLSNARLSKKVSNHCLSALAEAARSISFTKNEIALLDTLARGLPAWGRYPIPLTANELEREHILTPQLKDQFEEIFERLDLHIYEMIKEGWNGPHGYNFRGSIRSDLDDLPQGHEKMTFEELFKWRAEQRDGHGPWKL